MARYLAGAMLLAALFATGCASHGFGQSEEWRLRSLEESALEFEERQFEQIERLKAIEQAVGDIEARMQVEQESSTQTAMSEQQAADIAEIEQPDTSAMSPETLEALAMFEAMFEGKPLDRGGQVQETEIEPEPEADSGQQQAMASKERDSWDNYPKVDAEDKKAENKPAAKPEPVKKATAKGGSPTADYRKGLDLVLGDKPEQGRAVLEKFVKTWPEHELVPNALYWIGESHYSEKRMDQAILTFMDVYRRYPDNPKAAAALLKTAYAYQKLGDLRNARFYLTVLLEDFPDSEPAPLARRKMAEIGV
jgi:tol-pal system protein YbgF